MIVICPNSLKTQWVEAIEQAAPAIPVHYYNSQTKINTDHFLKHAESGVFIINYESVKSFVESGGTQKINLSRTFIVADESTKIKDPSSKAAKACIMLADMCAYQRILTGKPTANSNADVWSQLRFIQATNRNFTQHRYMFCQMGGWQDKTFVENQNTSVLQEEMMPYCYIAEDKYITDFKKVYEPMREIKLLPEQKETYDQMQSNLILELREGIKISAPIVLVKYLRLQQITSGIAGDIDGEQHNVIKPENNPKIQGVLDIINNECTNKVIVVCRFRLSVDNVYEVLTKNGYKCVKLIGGMSNEDLTNVKKDFNEGDAQIMVAQIQVLSYGHTLCATDEKPCDSVIFFENNFSLIDRAQSESRPEKYGRNVAISIYDFFASNMDRYMINSLIRKEEGSLSLMNYAREYGILNR
jgi:SNF2 family DNA or RNA helicase